MRSNTFVFIDAAQSFPLDSAPMKHFLLFLFVVLLPLQSVWAASSAYCAHEADFASQHIGHHSHKHAEGTADDETDEGSPSAKTTHNDCGLCHFGHCSYISSKIKLNLIDSNASPAGSALRLSLADIVTRPERPNWLSLA